MPFLTLPSERDLSTKFRGTNGQLLTRGLFYEIGYNKETSLYTLRDTSFKDLPSIYQLYMDFEDVTEFEFANTYFESYPHWEQISTSGFFLTHAARFRKELELKLKARAIKALISDADSDSKTALQANKYLLDHKLIKPEDILKPLNKREQAKERQNTINTFQHTDTIEKDYERIMN